MVERYVIIVQSVGIAVMMIGNYSLKGLAMSRKAEIDKLEMDRDRLKCENTELLALLKPVQCTPLRKFTNFVHQDGTKEKIDRTS